jgi:hypothetical protein
MRKNLEVSCILSLIVIMATFSCTTQPTAEQKANPIEGVWEFVTGEQITQDTVITYPGSQSMGMRSFKFITEKHWGVTGMIPSSETNWGFAGTYRLTDDTYVEYFVIQRNPENIGDSAVYNYKLDGYKWTISSDRLKEEWKRIE